MPRLPLPPEWRALVRRQAGAVSRAQCLAGGLSDEAIEAQLAARRWRRATTGCYVTYTGPVTTSTARWVALLYAGTGGVLSHATAGVMWDVVDHDPAAPVHVTVPYVRAVVRQPGIVVHRTRRPLGGVGDPPRTTAERTVLDLADAARTPTDALAPVARALRRRATTGERLSAELDGRRRQRWRALLAGATRDAASGSHSVLELRFLRDVERAHGLPSAIRQRPVAGTRQDVHYPEYLVTVELDGRLDHADAAGTWRDMRRDNASQLRGETTLRYGWTDVAGRPCEVAAQVGAALRSRGWRGPVGRCGPACRSAGV